MSKQAERKLKAKASKVAAKCDTQTSADYHGLEQHDQRSVDTSEEEEAQGYFTPPVQTEKSHEAINETAFIWSLASQLKTFNPTQLQQKKGMEGDNTKAAVNAPLSNDEEYLKSSPSEDTSVKNTTEMSIEADITMDFQQQVLSTQTVLEMFQQLKVDMQNLNKKVDAVSAKTTQEKEVNISEVVLKKYKDEIVQAVTESVSTRYKEEQEEFQK